MCQEGRKESGHKGRCPLRFGFRGLELGTSLAADAQNPITFLRISVAISVLVIRVFTNKGDGSNRCKVIHRVEHAI